MKTLILFRHGKAEDADSNMGDFYRSLKEQGISDSRLMGQKLKERNITLDQIIHSGATRAQQTAEALAKEFNLETPAKVVSWLYSDYSTGEFIDLISSLPDTVNTVLVVAHNPNISNVAKKFCHDCRVSFPTAANLTIAFDVNSWSEIDIYKGKMVAFDYPKNHK